MKIHKLKFENAINPLLIAHLTLSAHFPNLERHCVRKAIFNSPLKTFDLGS